jgi:hypothetical protein
MNISGSWYSPENKEYVQIEKLNEQTVYKGRSMNLCASLSMDVNAQIVFPWPKYITRHKISCNCIGAAKLFMVFPDNLSRYAL